MLDHVYKLLDLLYHNKDKSFSDIEDLYQTNEFGDGDLRDAIAILDEHRLLKEEFPDSGLVFVITTKGTTEYERETARRKIQQ